MRKNNTDDAPAPTAPSQATPSTQLEADSRKNPRRGPLKNLIFSLIATLLFFVLLEGGLRLIFPFARSATLPDTMIKSHLQTPGFHYDPDLYWYWAHLPSDAMDINRFGFRRIKPMSAKKPPGITRVVTLGDSQTLGAGVKPNESYSGQAERILGDGWEVLNAGISGYRSLNVYRLLQRRILYFEPDVVIIDCMPFDSPRDDGPLKGRALMSTTQRLQSLLFKSALFHTLQLGYEQLNPKRDRWLNEVPKDEPRRREQGLGNHDLIAEWGNANNVQVVFMNYPVWSNQGVLDCMTRPGELPPGVPIIPACKAIKKSGFQPQALFQDRNHMTVQGNEIVGHTIAQTLLAISNGR